MAGLLQNARSLLTNPRLFREYVSYLVPKFFGRVPAIATPFAGKVTASTFSQFQSAYCLMPSRAESNLVRMLTPAGGVYFDVGANVGAWSVMLSKCHPEAQVYSFEPSAGVFAVLQQNLALNGLAQARCEQLAISDGEGDLQFQEPRNASVFNRILLPGANDRDGRFTDTDIRSVRATSLDNYCREHAIDRIHFLKIDVEGAEPLVLRGLASMLAERRVDLIYIEIEPQNLESLGFRVEDIARAVEPAGYDFFRLEEDGTAGDRVDLRQVSGGNVLLLAV